MATNSMPELDLVADTLPLISRGKVRNLYEIDRETMLFIASDRISAYDVIMKNGVPGKGVLLTRLTVFWIQFLSKSLPSLRTHFLSLDLPANLPSALHRELGQRSMQVRRLQVFPIEAIVRGYITGSAWKEYQNKGTVHGIKLREGLRESEELPGGAMYTPSTKAEAGKNDENIHPDQAAEIVGEKYAQCIHDLAISLYTKAREYALERGIIIADTKFEFGLDTQTDEVILIDEVLTPDSSRFWLASSYKIGCSQNSFDKQYLRDWLTSSGLKGKQGVEMPDEIVRNTASKYQEAFERLVGST